MLYRAVKRILPTVNYSANRSISTFLESKENVVLTDDGSTFVCWHPEKAFPYEFSKPLPEATATSKSVLKTQNVAEVYKIFRDKTEAEVRAELMKISYTCKHKWFPHNQKTKRSKKTPPDRPYL